MYCFSVILDNRCFVWKRQFEFFFRVSHFYDR